MSIHARKTKNGVVYDVRWRSGGKNHGRTFRRKADAKAFDAEQDRRRRLGAHASGEASAMLLSEWLGKWMETRGATWEQTTIRSRGPLLDKWIAPYLGGMRLRDIGRSEVYAFLSAIRADGSPPVNTNNVLRCLSSCLGAAVDNELIPANPCHGVRKVRTAPTDRRAYPPETVAEIMDAMPTQRDRVIVAILAATGIRPAELVALRWRDVADGVIHVPRSVQYGEPKATKGLHDRSFAMERELVSMLAEFRPEHARPDDVIALPARGEFLNWKMWTRKVWHPVVRAKPNDDGTGGLGLPGVPYDLRHTAASTWIIRDGLDLITVAYRLGHGMKVTLDHYAHLFERARARAANNGPAGPAVAAGEPVPERRALRAANPTSAPGIDDRPGEPGALPAGSSDEP